MGRVLTPKRNAALILRDDFHFEIERNFTGYLRIDHSLAQMRILGRDHIGDFHLQGFRPRIAGNSFDGPVDGQYFPFKIVGVDDVAGVFKQLAVQLFVVKE